MASATCSSFNFAHAWQELATLTAAEPIRDDSLRLLSARLEEAANDSEGLPTEACGEFCRLLARLLLIASEMAGEPDRTPECLNSIIEFVQGAMLELDAAAAGNGPLDLDAALREASARWGDWLALLEYSQADRPVHTDSPFPPYSVMTPEWTDAGEPPTPSPEEVQLLLATLQAAREQADEPCTRSIQQSTAVEEAAGGATSISRLPVVAERCLAGDPVDLDEELLAAFLEDAARCLAAMEELAIAAPADRCDAETVRRVCRELHTLKGASASVGLNDIANYLHSVEETLQAPGTNPQTAVVPQAILGTVDELRRRIALHTGRTSAVPRPQEPTQAAGDDMAARADNFADAAGHIENTVRIKASQLDRLLDMLAGLVMLRNCRESRVVQLKRTNADLVSCVSRLRLADDGSPGSATASPGGTRRLTELVSDLQEVTRSLREMYEPIAEENQAVSHFIRQFRQELVQLSRLPLTGLFRRLQRAAHEAARTEGKSVRVQCAGGDIGVDRSLQERLYEPLLHIVRNAVSHGVEDEQKRTADGKPPQGTITLTAHSGINLLVLEVRDDGQGLDYEAIRRRGVERGLLASHQAASPQELAQLIFQPGFSTRQTAGKVAGRGVGMDVVAETLHRLRGWIEIESVAGSGSGIRLHVPMRSTIEHAMVFRSHGQVFGIPLTYVHRAGSWQEAARDAGNTPSPSGSEIQLPPIGFSQIFFPEDPVATNAYAVVLEHREQSGAIDRGAAANPSSAGSRAKRQRIALFVDEIVGPEEVVVRPLPPLLRHLPYCSGVTLSGSGETMLLLDGQQLCDLVLAGLRHNSPPDVKRRVLEPQGHEPPLVLAVDDSLSARRVLVKMLTQHGLRVQEATDGVQALEQFRVGRFAAVFSDVEMPRIDGLSLLERLKSDPQTANVPVVLVTSRDECELRQRAALGGAFAYLTKPLSKSSVSDVLSQLALCNIPERYLSTHRECDNGPRTDGEV